MERHEIENPGNVESVLSDCEDAVSRGEYPAVYGSKKVYCIDGSDGEVRKEVKDNGVSAMVTYLALAGITVGAAFIGSLRNASAGNDLENEVSNDTEIKYVVGER